MSTLDGQIALITGAGSPHGIGFASAKALGEDGATVILVSTTARIHDRRRNLNRMVYRLPDLLLTSRNLTK